MVAYLDQGGAQHLVKKILDRIQPVGSLYYSTNNTSPASLFGGSWERYAQGRVMVSASDTDTDFSVGKTGGSKTHTIVYDKNRGDSLSALISFDGKDIVALRNSNVPFIGDVHTANDIYGGSYHGGFGVALRGEFHSRDYSSPWVSVYIWRRTA